MTAATGAGHAGLQPPAELAGVIVSVPLAATAPPADRVSAIRPGPNGT
jgi:hypothetical protein